MSSRYLFLDTEWADTNAKDLVSLALVSDDGKRCFYAERDPLPTSPTEFVARVVYPLLERGPTARRDVAFCCELRAFIAQDTEAFILFDHAHDGELLLHALCGFELNQDALATCVPYVSPNMTLMHRDYAMTTAMESWFATHPEDKARRHHARVDAHVLRLGFLAVTGRTEPSLWPTYENFEDIPEPISRARR